MGVYIRKRPLLDPCPAEITLRVVGTKWTARVLYLLAQQPLGFSELKRGLPGISQQILAVRLRTLAQQNVVERLEDRDQPFYRLTARGRELVQVLDTVAEWGQTEMSTQMGIRWTPPDMDALRARPRSHA